VTHKYGAMSAPGVAGRPQPLPSVSSVRSQSQPQLQLQQLQLQRPPLAPPPALAASITFPPAVVPRPVADASALPSSRARPHAVLHHASLQHAPGPLRRGKWTSEEETYVARVIRDFNSGYLAAPAGTTLRSYLSDRLHCDPMRITKKFTGDSCIGKRVFHPVERDSVTGPAIDRAQSELRLLEERWRQRLLLQQKEASKRSGPAHRGPGSPPGPLAGQFPPGAPPPPTEVTRTAAWLDRAGTLLALPEGGCGDDDEDAARMLREVRGLIHEGAEIARRAAAVGKEIGSVPPAEVPPPASAPSPGAAAPTSVPGAGGPEAPAAIAGLKRPRDAPSPATGQGVLSSLATGSDAEALVGFLNSVRSQAR